MMENYKIKVNNEAESKEAQELFFELGCYWATGLGVKNLDAKFLYAKNNKITMGYCSDNFSDSGSCELTLPQLRDLVAKSKQTEQGLISGADALRALADGKEVEYFTDKWVCCDSKQLVVSWYLDDVYKFRLKPRTINLELEIPAPFEPSECEEFYVLSSVQPNGYIRTHLKHHALLGAWRTEEEIKQVVAALREAIKLG